MGGIRQSMVMWGVGSGTHIDAPGRALEGWENPAVRIGGFVRKKRSYPNFRAPRKGAEISRAPQKACGVF